MTRNLKTLHPQLFGAQAAREVLRSDPLRPRAAPDRLRVRDFYLAAVYGRYEAHGRYGGVKV